MEMVMVKLEQAEREGKSVLTNGDVDGTGDAVNTVDKGK